MLYRDIFTPAVLSGLSPLQRQVAEYIILSEGEIERLTITELAKASGVSPSSITKFCRAIGFDSFKEFKLALAKAKSPELLIESEDVANSLAGRIQRSLTRSARVLEQTKIDLDITSFEKAIEALENANRIVCFGVGGSGVIAADARFRFLRLGLSSVAYTDTHVQLWSTIGLDSSDLIIAVSHSGRTPETLEVLSLAKESGSTTIALTSFKYSPLAKLAYICLISTYVEAPFDDGSVLARVSQLGIIDALADELAYRNPDYVKRAMRLNTVIQSRKRR